MKETRVLIYVRVSKKKGDKMSLSNQMREAEQLANEKGWVIVHRFIENGKSAYKRSVRRPHFEHAMEMVRKGNIDIFLVWKLDRFYRSGLECQLAIEELKNHGCQFASVMEPNLDNATAQGRSFIAGLAYGAEIRSEDTGKAISSWHRGNLIEDETRANGSTGAAIPAGWRPYGYDRPSKSVLTINEHEANVIRDSAERILAGTATFLRLIREHQPLSVQSTEANPIPMTGPGLKRILINPTTYGFRRGPEGSMIRGCWQPILDIEMFGPMVGLLTDPIRRTHDSSGNEIRHALSGVVRCGDSCGDSLRFRRWVKTGSYRYHCRCGNSIDGPAMESVIDDRLWQSVTPAVWQSWRTEGKGYDPSVLDAITQRTERLHQMFLMGEFDHDMDSYNTNVAALKSQREAAMNHESLDIPDVESIHEAWATLDASAQRKVYRQAFPSITVNRCAGSYDPHSRIAFA